MKKTVFFLLLFLSPFVFYGQENRLNRSEALVPPYHWQYEYLTALRIRGYLTDLNFSRWPYGIGNIADAVTRLNDGIETGEIKTDAVTRILIMHMQRGLQSFGITDTSYAHLSGQVFLDNDFSYPDIWSERDASILRGGDSDKDKWINRYTARGRIGLQVGKNLTVQNTILLDNRLDENPSYLGKRQSGAASYTEEAYLLYRTTHFNFLLGRSFIRWGPGQTGTLLLSDYSRPLDQFYADFEYKWLRYSFVTATLNPLRDSVSVNRYMTAHRLDLQLRHNLWFGINEAVLYGGAGESAQFSFLNPVIFYHGEVLNGLTDGNTLGSIDFSYYPVRNVNIYGELLIDDIQLEKSGPGDLEPSEWGLLLGTQGAFRRLFLQAEYVRITNRTYKTAYYWERFTHRNDPIGYYLGNDFDHLRIRGNCWINQDLRLQAMAQVIRQGEGRIDTPFDTPWFNTTLGEKYSEPFPTGVVATSRRIQLELRWQLSQYGFGEFVFGNEHVKNVDNIFGKRIDGWYYDIKFWLEIGKNWKI